MTVAVKTIAKLQPIVLDLKTMLLGPSTQKFKAALESLPSQVAVEAAASFQKVHGMYNECQQRMHDASAILLFGLQEVGEAAQRASKAAEALRKFPQVHG